MRVVMAPIDANKYLIYIDGVQTVAAVLFLMFRHHLAHLTTLMPDTLHKWLAWDPKCQWVPPVVTVAFHENIDLAVLSAFVLLCLEVAS